MFIPIKRSRYQAFTLIELLVVISIIALLISILLPALASARASARRIGCASKLKNIGIAMAAYQYAYNDWVAPFYYEEAIASGKQPNHMYNGGGHWWDSWVGKNFFRYRVDQWGWCFSRKTWQGFKCPEDSIQRNAGTTWTNRTYGLAGYLMTGKGGTRGNMQGVRATEIFKPSRTYSVLEVNTLTDSNYSRNGVLLTGSTANPVAMYGTTSIRRWHMGSTNILYLDGHVATQKKWKQTSFMNTLNDITE